jgi:N-acetylglucosaminyldiphosphoundecaprenol N-acetyl-beta-D-mannosaminyltransferase
MRVDFLGSPVDSLDMRDALERVDGFVCSGEPHHIMVSNANKFWLMRREPRLARIAQQADLILPERVVAMCSALLGSPLKSDVAGIAFAKELLPHCEKMGHSIFFLGARSEVMKSLMKMVRREYPALNVVGYHHGYFLKDGNEAVVEKIRKSKPDVLIVALGSPLQEYWIRDHFDEMSVPVSIGVGGSFDVIAGLKKDAPQWIRKSGFEWLYRLIQDPKRYWKRYSIIVPFLFVTLFIEGICGFKPRKH